MRQTTGEQTSHTTKGERPRQRLQGGSDEETPPLPASKDEAWAFTRRAQDLQAGEKRSFTAAPPRRKTTPAGAAAIGSDRGQIRVHTRSTRIRRRLAGPTVRPARQPILPSPPRASRHRHQAAPPPSTTTKRSLRHHHQPAQSGETAPSPPAQRPRRPAHPQAPPAAERQQNGRPAAIAAAAATRRATDLRRHHHSRVPHQPPTSHPRGRADYGRRGGEGEAARATIRPQ